MALLELREVRAHDEGRPVLRGITLSVEEGERTAVVGPQGAGKTPLLAAVAGTIRVSGEMRFDGELVTRAGPAAMARLGVAHVPQGGGVFSPLSVLDNLRLGAWHRRGALDIALAQVFEVFPLLHVRRRLRAGSLTAPEQRMLAVARALMAKPRLLLVDEPSHGVSGPFARELFSALRRVNESGTTMLVAEQRPGLAAELAGRTVTLDAGRIASVDAPTGLSAAS